MWPFKGRFSIRRSEIRRTRTERASRWRDRLRIDVTLPAAALGLIIVVVSGAIMTWGGDALSVRVGQRLARPYASRVNFEVADQRRTVELRVQARDSSPNYYLLDEALIDDIAGRLGSAATLAKAHFDDPERLRNEVAANKVLLDDAAVAELRRLVETNATEQFTNSVRAAAGVLRVRPLVEPEEVGVRRTARQAVLYDPDAPQDRTLGIDVVQFATGTGAEASAKLARIADEAARVFSEPLRPSVQASLVAMLTSDTGEIRPIYRYDAARTLEVARQAEAAVPAQFYRYAEGDVLADAGEVTREEYALLAAENDAAARRAASERTSWLDRSDAARWALSALVVFGVLVYLVLTQPRPFENLTQRVVMTGVILATLLAVRWGVVSANAPPAFAAGAVALCAGLLGIVYHHSSAFAVSAGLVTLVTLAVEQDVTFLVMLSLVSAIFLFGLRDVRNRGKIVLVGAGAAAAAFMAMSVNGLLDRQSASFVLEQALWAAGATFVASFVIEGVLPGIERAFRISTGMSLLEWCDANKPLMRMMAAEAPGTYNHSLLVGALAEGASEAIGANGLLARAGAYYHDIGKINKPEYFVENQLAGASRHERLSPAMSLLIIVGHVKDGIEMAREYSLPASLHPFIAEHHGTTLVEYFYHAASRARRPDDPEVKDTEFRYPGPKPQSRETAIVMLCDGVEGAVRAMTEPTPGRIEAVVSEIVRKRLVDGQLDECDLNFRELAEVEKTIVRSLCAIYHGRIQYPSQDAPAGTARSAS